MCVWGSRSVCCWKHPQGQDAGLVLPTRNLTIYSVSMSAMVSLLPAYTKTSNSKSVSSKSAREAPRTGLQVLEGKIKGLKPRHVARSTQK